MEILLGSALVGGARLALVSDAFAVEGGVLAALTLIIVCVVSIGRVPRAAHLCDAATLPSLVAVHALASSASAAPWLRLQLRCSLCCCAAAVLAAACRWNERSVAAATAGGSVAVAALVWWGPEHAADTAARSAAAATLSLAAAAALRRALPGSFSLGEASLMAQVASLLLLNAGAAASPGAAGAAPPSDADTLVALLRCGVSATIAACAALSAAGVLWHLRTRSAPPIAPYLAACAALFTGMILPWCAQALPPRAAAEGEGEDAPLVALAMRPLPPLAWIYRFLRRDRVAAAIVAYWLATLPAALWLIGRIRRSGALRRIEVRKLFHALALLLFVPALIARPHFLALAYGVALCVGLLVECTRALRVAQLGDTIEAYMRQFTDDRDDAGAGAITTHLYLLIGCAAPLWLHVGLGGGGQRWAGGAGGVAQLLPMCGLLAIGVGDAAAAIVGNRLARTHRWRPHSGRSVEGSLAMLLSMVVAGGAALGAISLTSDAALVGSEVVAAALGGAEEGYGLGRGAGVAAALLTTTLLEALTDQIDNLVIPLHAYAALALAVW